MDIPTPQQIHRPSLFTEYVNNQVDYICRMRNITTEEERAVVTAKVQTLVQNHYTTKKCKVAKCTGYGREQVVDQDLWSVLKLSEKYIVAPNGVFYKPPYQTQSIISKMMIDKLAERKKIKKIQLQAEGTGDDVLAKRCWFQQATIKINCNSLPGGFASAYNIFYCKAGYNVITATARWMIARAYTICEQLLGGNFAWFSVGELINFITIVLRHMPPVDDIQRAIKKYKLKKPTKDMLQTFYVDTLKQYVPTEQLQLDNLFKLLDTLTQDEIIFLYYYGNLRHIIWDNETIFKPYIKHLFNVADVVVDNTVTKDDAFNIDETVTTLVTVAFASDLGNYGLVDICNDHPEYIPKLVAYSKVTEKKLKALTLLMETFINTTADIPDIQHKPMTWRNTTIVSDTDSVIFTAAAWDDWYRGVSLNVNNESYQISSLVVYWLHHSVVYALKRFSVAIGVTGNDVSRLAMKNEFLYPVMMIFDAKKTYVGIQKVKEGVILPKPKADVKGQSLRGSSICSDALEFSESLMVKKILEPVMEGAISGDQLIQYVVDFEKRITQSILDRDMTFLKITSLKSEKDYKNPLSTSAYKAWDFWQKVFAADYGDLHPPTKVKVFEITQPTAEYFEWLEKESPKLYKRFRKYIEEKKQLPNQLIINPTEVLLPKEMVQLVNIRAVIWHNIQPTYDTLNRVNISVGCEKHKLLLSDVYG